MSAYADLIPGAEYPLQFQVRGASGTPLTGSTIKLDLDPPNEDDAAARVSKTVTSFVTSTYGLAGGAAVVTLTADETAAMGSSPGEWLVVWRKNGQAMGPIRFLTVTPMSKGRLT